MTEKAKAKKKTDEQPVETPDGESAGVELITGDTIPGTLPHALPDDDPYFWTGSES
jgi:hypothetical protein